MIALILLLIIVIVAVAAVNLMNRTLNRQGKFSYSQRVLWIFGGYTVILVLCLGITSIFPPSEIAGIKRVNSKELDEENVTLYNAASEGKFDEINRKFISKTWEFVYNGQQLNLAGPKQEDLNTAIMVERKNTNDNKIEAFYFRTRSSVNGLDITKRVKLPRLELGGDELTLINPEKTNLKFSEFTSAFSVKQFIGESAFEHQSNFTGGQSILYLKIPKNLNLIDLADLNPQYVKR